MKWVLGALLLVVAKRSSGVTQEVNQRNPIVCRHRSMQVRGSRKPRDLMAGVNIAGYNRGNNNPNSFQTLCLTLLRICVNASQTVQGHHPDRICILVHRTQAIRIIFMNMHYNGFFYEHSENWLWTLNSVAENWVWEKFSPVSGTFLQCNDSRSYCHEYLCWTGSWMYSCVGNYCYLLKPIDSFTTRE